MDKDQQKRYDEYKSTNFTFQSIQKVRFLGYARRARGGTRADRVFFFWVWVRRSSSSWSVWGESICLGLIWSTWTDSLDRSYGSSIGFFDSIFINRLNLLLILPSPPRALDIPPRLLSLSPVIPRPLTPPAGLSRSVPRRRTYRQECGWVDRGGRQGACGGDY